MSFSTSNPDAFVAKLALLGAAVGLGQLLASKEQISARLVAGRTLVSAGLGAAASIPLSWTLLPDAAAYGLACGLVTVGTAGVERLISRFIGPKE
jgi:hypothetical protein